MLDEEITKEEVYTDYVKLAEIENERKTLFEKLETLTLEYFAKMEEYEI